MSSFYPAGPASVPANFSQPGPAYRRQAWVAMLSLFAFAALYLAMMGWLGWTAYRLLQALLTGTTKNVIAAALVGGGAAFLALFMAKALVFVKRGSHSDDIEITAAEQPRLFEFLLRVAAETGAPRPHRVYVSPAVNAAVFYDLSLANLIFPSRKNLLIGLGLVNVLNLSEFKAVLAHEFGHFAQRTMAVGRWVYIAQQIAGHIVERRDAFDSMLAGLSRIDLRVAWIGWVLRLVVWSIRSLVELFFRLVVLAQRALSREMEYQADLVAASVSGSDALVHALMKLQGADDAWDRAVNFASGQMAEGRSVSDLFAIQTRIVEQMRRILADPHFCNVPPIPASAPDQHRVFRSELAQPPRMWSTHPASSDREHNVKRTYLPAELDDRPAWQLFDQADELRRRVSASVFSGERPEEAALDEILQCLDQDFDRPSLNRRYRGSFLGRSPVRHATSVGELYGPKEAPTQLHVALAEFYDDKHDADLDRLRSLQQEHASLAALRAGHLVAEGGVLRWRGQDLARRELPNAIATLDSEIEQINVSLRSHDQRCRSLHLQMAEQLGQGWPEFLRGLLTALHYAEHTLADLRDANGVLNNTYHVVTADGNVSAGEMTRLINSCNVVQAALAVIYNAAPSLHMGQALNSRLGIESWAAALGEFKLPEANKDNLNNWLRAVDSWIGASCDRLSALRSQSLDLLLQSEQQVADAFLAQESLPPAPEAPVIPPGYPTLVPGTERKRIDRLSSWDRFQMADGYFASIARFVVAASIVGSVLALGWTTGNTKLSVYNGLARAISVEVDGKAYRVGGSEHVEVDIDQRHQHVINTQDDQGNLIESFEADGRHGAHFIYNVAAATPLVEWAASYGNAAEVPERGLSGQRWQATSADHVFSEPPETISTKRGGDIRRVVSAINDGGPGYQLAQLADENDKQAMIRAHALWDGSGAAQTLEWMYVAADLPDYSAILQHRLALQPNDVLNLRLLQDSVEGSDHEAVCAQHRKHSEQQPDSGDWAYLAIRCMEDGTEQDAAFIEAHQRQPDHPWLAYAAARSLAQNQRWDEALNLLLPTLGRLPAIANVSSVDVLRLQRLLGVPAEEQHGLAERFPRAEYALSAETGEGWPADSAMHGFVALAGGDLDKAEQWIERDAHSGVDLRMLLAASKGASARQVRAGLQFENAESPSVYAVWPAVALSLREGADPGALLEQARSGVSNQNANTLWAFLQAVHSGASAESAEAQLGSIDLRLRGIAYASAAVLLGNQCPSHWRELAQKLLFASERPYIG